MDEQRYDELIRKRGETGLSRDEADELGRLMAEQEGKPYSHNVPPGEADAERPTASDEDDAERPVDEERAERAAEVAREEPRIERAEEGSAPA